MSHVINNLDVRVREPDPVALALVVVRAVARRGRLAVTHTLYTGCPLDEAVALGRR